MGWDTVQKGDRVELGLLQVDIVDHSKIQANDRTLGAIKTLFRQHMEGIAAIHQGRLFVWAGDGGSFMFLTGQGEGFDSLVFSAIQTLSNLALINDQIALVNKLETPLSIRITCDTGVAGYDPDPGLIAADFINDFLKHERAVGHPNSVVITDRVLRGIAAGLQQRVPPLQAFSGGPCTAAHFKPGG